MEDSFSSHRQKSKFLSEKAKTLIAGGITSELRYALPFPIFISKAKGSRKWDVDGNEYIDYSMGSAALLLGHSHDAIVDAVNSKIGDGTLYSALTEQELEWAELISDMYPSSERVRFVGSGTEANILAIRIARAFKGRSKIIRFEGHFHGWGDDTNVGIKFPFDKPVTHGLPPNVVDSSVVCPADLKYVEEVLSKDKDIAAIILEPSGASWGTVPIPDAFLQGLRKVCDLNDVVLIFDEVITGFRWSPGGVQALEGVTPDLTTLAKNLTGGLPGGCVAGKSELMDLLDPSKEFKGLQAGVFHRGTFNANPLSTASGIVALEIFKLGEVQQKADLLAGKLRQNFSQIFKKHEIAGFVYGESSTFHIYLGSHKKDDLTSLNAHGLKGIPQNQVLDFQMSLRSRGVDLLSYTGGVTSSAHTEDDIERTISVFEDSIVELIENDKIPRL
ncbi:MAG: aspartate aminotransferase family protein [Nitrospinota bacterium]|nr:aspartate aminotransferase family protein [Nitrospinota bacterium]